MRTSHDNRVRSFFGRAFCASQSTARPHRGTSKSSCRHCSCYRQEDRAASLSNFPRSRVPQKRRLAVVEEKEDPSIPGSTGKATLRRQGREQSSSRGLLSRGEKSMAAPTRVVCRANVDRTSQPPGTAAGCGSSLAWWNRLTTTLSGAPGLLS